MSQLLGVGEPSDAGRTSAARVGLGDLAPFKALARPRRRRMLEHFTLHGPATSATLARALGRNTGSTSYRLRELVGYGFVERTESRSAVPEDGRVARETDAATQRETRRGGARHRSAGGGPVPGDLRFLPRSRQSPEMWHVMDELNHHDYAADLGTLRTAPA
ncbi:winged helix-turn-helix domain-containing protein [Streptomyces sp. NPDC014995]|uniref:winged helix-turn-helix domain-containing protein n=1 Tax=Streptomyces sp. NPDC014995 TaxID=3364936 RepID=UPI0036FE6FA9